MNPLTHGIVVEAAVKDCTIEIYVNDIPIGLCGIGVSNRTAIPVNEFLIDGYNELAMLINPGDTPQTSTDYSRLGVPAHGAQPPPDPTMDAYLAQAAEEEREAAGDEEQLKNEDPNPEIRGLSVLRTARAAVRLAKYPVGATAGDGSGEELMSVEWAANDNYDDLRREKQPFPIWLYTSADLGEMFGPCAWQKAQRLKLDPKTYREVVDFVMKVQMWVENGISQPILDKSRDRFEEVSRAYGIDAEERAEVFQQILEQENEKDYWIFETPEEEEFDLRLCAKNRMIECISKDWKTPIRGVPDDENGRFLFPMMVGKLEGADEFSILR